MKPKIAIYSGRYPDTTFLTLLARNLAKKDFEIHIYGKLIQKNRDDKKIKFYTFPFNNKIKTYLFLLKYSILNFLFNYKKLFLFFKLIHQDNLYLKYKKALVILPMLYHKPDIIHLQWLKSYELFNGLSPVLSAKFIVSIRGHQLSISSFIYPRFKNNTIEATNEAYKIHSISDDLSKQLLLINPSVHNKIYKINPAIDLKLFSISESSLNRDRHMTLKIITVCRLSWKKGLVDAIRALKLIFDKGIDFEYLIIGDGEQCEELEFMINDLGLSNKIKLLGKMSQQEVKGYLLNADIFMMPSVQEGFSNAVIEAQALGLPCIVSDAEGLEENIENGKTGFVFRKREIAAIALLVEKFIAMPKSDYIEMRKNAVIQCRIKYDVNKQIEQFKNLYLDV